MSDRYDTPEGGHHTPKSSLKKRIQELEGVVEEHASLLEALRRAVTDAESESRSQSEILDDLQNGLRHRIEKQVEGVVRENDQKFALQNTENKRVVTHIESLESRLQELSQLRSAATSRVSGIERDFGEEP